MRRIPSRTAVAALTVVAALGGSTAQAAEKTQHQYGSVIQNAPVSTSHGYPGVGGTAVLAGTWQTRSSATERWSTT
jgi:hypothetical protein